MQQLISTLLTAVIVVQPVAAEQEDLHTQLDFELVSGEFELTHEVVEAGSIAVWVESEVFDPSLRIERAFDGSRTLDLDSGGGTTPYLVFTVEPGQEYRVSVTAGAAEHGGSGTLHVVTILETDRTNEATRAALVELRAIHAMMADRKEARGRVESAIEGLLELEGRSTSRRAEIMLWNFGKLAYQLGQQGLAARAWRATVEHRSRTMPSTHPDLLEGRQNLGAALTSIGAYVEGGALFEEVLAAQRRLLPEGHPAIIGAMQNVAAIATISGDHSRAHRLNLEIHDRREATLEPDDPLLFDAKRNLAVTSLELGDLERAHSLGLAVTAFFSRTVGPDDPNTVDAEETLAATLRGLGHVSAAFELYRKVLDARERSLPEASPEVERARLGLAIAAGEAGNAQLGLKLATEVLAARASRLPEGHRDRVRAAQVHASALKQCGQLEAALVARQRIHKTLAASLGGEHVETLDGLRDIGIVELAQWRNSAASIRFEEYLETLKRVAPDDDVRRHQGLLLLGSSLKNAGDPERALALLREGMELQAQRVPVNHPHAISAKLTLAHLLVDVDRPREALMAIEEASAAIAALPPRHSAHGTEAIVRARALHQLGDHTAALAVARAITARWTSELPPDHPELLAARHVLSVTLSAAGDVAEALEIQEEIHVAWSALLPKNDPNLFTIRRGLASNRMEAGDLDGARELAASTLEAAARELGPGHRQAVKARRTLAIVERRAGRHARARQLFEENLRLAESSKERRATQTALWNLAVLESDLGDDAAARERFLEIRNAEDHSGGARVAEEVMLTLNLAVTTAASGNATEAQALYEEVLATWDGALPDQHPYVQTARMGLARLAASAEDWALVASLVERILEGQEGAIAMLRGESERTARSAARQEVVRLGRAVELVLMARRGGQEVGRLETKLFEVLEGLRSLSVGSTLSSRAAGDTPESAAARARLRTLSTELARLTWELPVNESDVAPWRAALLRTTEERDQVERQLAALRPGTHDRSSPRGHGWLARRLSPHQALVTYLRHGRDKRLEGALTGSGASDAKRDALVAFVVLPGGELAVAELGSVSPVERAIEDWRASIGRPLTPRGLGASRLGSTAAGGEENVEAGRTARRLLLDPIRPLAPDATEWAVVVDDCLHVAPLAALPTDAGRFGDEVRVRYLTHVGQLLTPPKPPEGKGTLVAVGGIEYAPPSSDRGDSPAESPFTFAALPGTAREVQEIGATFGTHHGGQEAIVLTGANATKDAIHTAVEGSRWVHLATHGWFTEPAASGARGALLSADETVSRFAPLVRCGLALTHANGRSGSDGPLAGVLTAGELARIDLAACELAVLSACETNVGIRHAGQGIQSLQSALHAAGARSAITSLWKVDDEATRLFFSAFYRALWRDGTSKAEALWATKAQMRKQGLPLAAWAGWVLTGDLE